MEIEKGKDLPLPLAVFYIVKSSVGVGILFLPACFARLGLVNSLIVTIISALLNCLTSVWIGELAFEAKTTNLVKLCDQLWLRTSVSAVGVLMSITTLVVYMRLVVDSMSFLNVPRFLLTILASSLVLPFCLLRETKTISWIALLGLVGMLYVLILVLVDLFTHFPKHLDDSLFKNLTLGSIGPIANITYSLECTFWIPAVSVSIASPTGKPIFISFLIITFTYLLMGSAGFLRHPDISSAVIHVSQSIPYRIAQMCLSVVYIISFPLVLAPIRAILASTIKCTNSFIYNLFESSTFVLLISTVSLIAPSTTVAIADTVGALGNAPIALCLPAYLAHRAGKLDSIVKKGLAGCCALSGGLLWIGGVVNLILKYKGRVE